MNILKPRVSVLMTVYNAEKYLKYSVSSILKQSFKSLKLVVVDDCSTDNSREVLKSFKDKRIKKFYLKKHSGRTPALNFGLKKMFGFACYSLTELPVRFLGYNLSLFGHPN